jgi:hypothetical protein
MKTWVKVIRYHLVQPVIYLAGPWGLQAFIFVLTLIVFSVAGTGHSPHPYTGGVAEVFIVPFIVGALCISRSLPFGLALGVSRRSYYTGTALLALIYAAVYGPALTALQAVERATGGWGVNMHHFGCRTSWRARGTSPG